MGVHVAAHDHGYRPRPAIGAPVAIALGGYPVLFTVLAGTSAASAV
jgi:hypothetical protein